MMKHKGIKIVPVKVTRYEVRDVSGQKLKTFSNASAARAWIDGYMSASDRAAKAAGATPPAPPYGALRASSSSRQKLIDNTSRLV